MERDTLKYLLTLVVEEMVFLDRGYGHDKPQSVQVEYQRCKDAREWLEARVELLNQREGLHE
jgi:hypothetical protein